MDTDVVIVGGGIAGLSLAWALAPTRKVVLIEAEDSLAHHTSSRSARQMQPNYGPDVIQRLTLRSIAMVEKISDHLTAPILVPRPLITLGSQADVEALIAEHPTLKLLDHGQTMAHSPDLRPEYFAASALDDTAKEVDVPALLEHYRTSALAAGAVILTGAPLNAVAVRTTPPGASGERRAEDDAARFAITAGGHEITAATLVNAAGAWADQVAGLFRLRPRGLVPHRRSVAIVSTDRPVDPAGPMVEPADETFYYRPDGGHLLISPCESVPAPAGDAQVVESDITQLIQRLGAVTMLGINGVVRAWTGLRTETADGVPVVGFDKDLPGFFWLAGQGGYGIQTSAALGTLAAQLITGTLPPADEGIAAALDPQREGLV